MFLSSSFLAQINFFSIFKWRTFIQWNLIGFNFKKPYPGDTEVTTGNSFSPEQLREFLTNPKTFVDFGRGCSAPREHS